MRVLVLSALLIVSLAPRAVAHEFWLAPSLPRAAAGDTVVVAAFVGTGFHGERVPFAAMRAIHLTARTVRDLDLTMAATEGAHEFGRFVLPDDAGALVAYESNFAFIQLEPEAFDAYLALEGLDGPRAERARRGVQATAGRERYARCPKTWIAGSDARRATRAVGQTLEIVPLAAPGRDSVLEVRVLYQGKPLTGALVRAWHRSTAAGMQASAEGDSVGPVIAVRSARDGRARLALPAAGFWLVSAVHMVACPEAQADWQSYWASLTFTR